MVTSQWAANDGLRLHYLVAQADGSGVPLVFLPGGLGSADDYWQDLPEFAPRPVLAMSLRGQGQSDAPERGYALDDYVADVSAVLQASGVKRPCLMAYSMAVPTAIAFAARHPEALAGLILGDYPAQAFRLPPEWVERAVVTLARLSDRHVMEAMQRESADVDLWDQLPRITCPVLVLRGRQPGARLSAADAGRYQTLLPRARILTFPNAAHALWEPDPAPFFTALKTFLAQLDSARRVKRGA
ncbi:MAG: alpha/beta fold hydrolase [Anaerolineales bacterium]|nr:alpha/beta fold hydrolase [Anaerolineales bacterium]